MTAAGPIPTPNRATSELINNALRWTIEFYCLDLLSPLRDITSRCSKVALQFSIAIQSKVAKPRTRGRLRHWPTNSRPSCILTPSTVPGDGTSATDTNLGSARPPFILRDRSVMGGILSSCAEASRWRKGVDGAYLVRILVANARCRSGGCEI